MKLMYSQTSLFVALALFGASYSQLTAQAWQAAPIGKGEGGQRIMALDVASQDPDYLIFGTDVGGLYHSTDGGEHWTITNIGFEALGACSMIIDPKNNDRIYVVGSAQKFPFNRASNGIYRSTDRGLTWEWVMQSHEFNDHPNHKDRRDQIVVDPTSYDEELGYCTDIYYAGRPKKKLPKEEERFLYKSTDGGDTWQALDTMRGVSWLAVHSSERVLYVGNWNGVFRSTDGGNEFEQTFKGRISGMDAVDGYVVICTRDNEVFISNDSGKTFVEAASQGLEMPNSKKHFLHNIRMHPTSPRRLLTQFKPQKGGQRVRFVSHDGGATWEKSRYVSPRPIAGSSRPGLYADFVWHPTDPNICWAHNESYMIKSTDGGKTFHWSNSGYTGIFLGQGNSFHFNVHNPDYIGFPSADFDGAVTFNSGEKWYGSNIQPKTLWGWTYGLYAVGPGVWFGGQSATHFPSKLKLMVTRDYGKTFKSFKLKSDDLFPNFSSYQDLKDPDVWFYTRWRSDNAGYNWKKMKGCRAVFTHDPVTKALYGWGTEADGEVVFSKDSGKTWQTVVTFPGKLRDIAVDPVNRLIYGAAGKQMFQYSATTGEVTELTAAIPRDQKDNALKIWSVAVDPQAPHIVYTVSGAHYYQADNGMMRSLDSGKTWHSLTVAKRWDNLHFRTPGGGGGVEGLWVRVHPVTREAYFGSNDFGFYKIGPPLDGEQLTVNGEQ